MNTILIVGATGVVGEAALTHFAGQKQWHTIALSRRTPDLPDSENFQHFSVDLTNPDACRQLAPSLNRVTHVIYAAVAEQPGLLKGWRDRAQMDLNLSMLRNLMEPLIASASGLQHISLLQGAKAYGAHVGHVAPIPARESAPRDDHENFYWLQEDYIRDISTNRGIHWTVFRPQVIIGGAHGAAMNPLLPLAAYAAIRREEGKPFSYPGGEIQIGELVDATLIARALEWAALERQARNEIFNITNGDVFTWRDAWPHIARMFDTVAGPDQPMRLSEYLLQRGHVWDQIVARKNLRPLKLTDFLGQSHHYIDILLRSDATIINRPTLLSTIKLRRAGFTACTDSHDTLSYWIDELKRKQLIPA